MHNPIKRPCLSLWRYNVYLQLSYLSCIFFCLRATDPVSKGIQGSKILPLSLGAHYVPREAGNQCLRQRCNSRPSKHPQVPFCHSELHLEDQSVRQRMSCDKSQIASLLKRRGNGPKFGKRGIGLWSIWLHVNVFKCILYILYLLFLDVQHASFRCIHLQHSSSKVQNYTKKLREWTCRSGDGALIQKQELVKRPVLPGCFDGIFRASWAMSHKQKWPSWLNFPIWIEKTGQDG